MADIFVLAEHRTGELRDVTFEMLSLGNELAEKTRSSLTAMILGHHVETFAKKLADHAGKVLALDHPRLENFNAVDYCRVMAHLIKKHNPLLTLIGHTAFGMDLAPSLAAELRTPLATDCIDIGLEGENLTVTRQMYGGKVNVKCTLRKAQNYLVTVRPAAIEVKEEGPKSGAIVSEVVPELPEVKHRKFLGYIEAPKGEVDITRSDLLVSVGRGIRDAKNIPIVESLAKTLGATLSCSRPVVDKGWLPKDRQVGTSGKTVKPKVYMAIGISGAFQHIAGMKASALVIAINKDPKAPIFRMADYGVVDDLFKVIPAIQAKASALKSERK